MPLMARGETENRQHYLGGEQPELDEYGLPKKPDKLTGSYRGMAGGRFYRAYADPYLEGQAQRTAQQNIADRAEQESLYKMLQAQAKGGVTPQQQAQLSGFTQAAQNQQTLATGARGGAYGASAARAALTQGAGIQGAQNVQMQRQLQAQDQLSAQSQMQGLSAAMRAQDLIDQGMSAEQAFHEAQLGLRGRALQTQGEIGYAGLEQGALQQNMQGYLDWQRRQIQRAQLRAQQDQADRAAMLGAVGTMASTGATLSDRRAKQEAYVSGAADMKDTLTSGDYSPAFGLPGGQQVFRHKATGALVGRNAETGELETLRNAPEGRSASPPPSFTGRDAAKSARNKEMLARLATVGPKSRALGLTATGYGGEITDDAYPSDAVYENTGRVSDATMRGIQNLAFPFERVPQIERENPFVAPYAKSAGRTWTHGQLQELADRDPETADWVMDQAGFSGRPGSPERLIFPAAVASNYSARVNAQPTAFDVGAGAPVTNAPTSPASGALPPWAQDQVDQYAAMTRLGPTISDRGAKEKAFTRGVQQTLAALKSPSSLATNYSALNNPITPKDDARFGELGELARPDGGVSSELSLTVTDPRLYGGRPTNIPSLVRGQENVPGMLSGEDLSRRQEEIAIERALQRKAEGAFLPSYSTISDAERAAQMRTEGKSAGVVPLTQGDRYEPLVELQHAALSRSNQGNALLSDERAKEEAFMSGVRAGQGSVPVSRQRIGETESGSAWLASASGAMQETAGTPATQREQAKSAYDRGAAAFKAGDYEGAVRSFSAAQSISPNPTTAKQIEKAQKKMSGNVSASAIAPTDARLASDATLDALSRSQSLYQYKPGITGPTSSPPHLGVMAQDLEKVPTGASLVSIDPRTGLRNINAPAGLSAAFSGLGRLNERLRMLESGRR